MQHKYEITSEKVSQIKKVHHIIRASGHMYW